MLQELIKDRAYRMSYISLDEIHRPMHWDLVYKSAQDLSWRERKMAQLRRWMKKDLSDKVSDVCLKILDAEISTLIYAGMICGIMGTLYIMVFSFGSAALTLEEVADANTWQALRMMHATTVIGWITMSLVFGYASGFFEESLIGWLNGKYRK